jgi:hypothetical protein
MWSMLVRRTTPPGYFPHIFINGAHQWNNSWTALLSNLCDDAQFAGAPACQTLAPVAFMFEVLLTGNKSVIRAHAAAFSASVALGVNYAASQIALPAGFRTKGEPDNAPSYVNIHAVGYTVYCTVLMIQYHHIMIVSYVKVKVKAV